LVAHKVYAENPTYSGVEIEITEKPWFGKSAAVEQSLKLMTETLLL
jgi:hypothetical protein